MGRAWHYARAATSLLRYAPNPFGLVAAYTPTVERGYCVTEQDIVLNHRAGFIRQERREEKRKQVGQRQTMSAA